MQHRYVEVTSYLMSDDVISDVIKNAVYEDGHLIKAFQKEKNDIAGKLLKEFANNKFWSRRWLNLKNDKFGSVS